MNIKKAKGTLNMCDQKMTLAEIASKAGVSIATVSRVIHQSHLTSKRSQELVQNAMKKLGVNCQKVKAYACEFSSKKILVLDHQLMTQSQINYGIEFEAKNQGYTLIYLRFLEFNPLNIQQIITYVKYQKIDGIMMINGSPYETLIVKYQQALPPIILVNQFSRDFSCVYCDSMSIGFKATQYFLKHGHQRIALLLGDKNRIENEYFKQGYRQALSKKPNYPNTEDYIVYHCFHYCDTVQAMKKLMKLAMPPTAIICTDNSHLTHFEQEITGNHHSDFGNIMENQICGVIDQCKTMNIKIPEDLSLLQSIYHKKHKSYQPLNYICGIYYPFFEMGQRSVLMLIKKIKEARVSSIKNTSIHTSNRYSELIETEIIQRHSTSNRNF